jgi:hypothetical protein
MTRWNSIITAVVCAGLCACPGEEPQSGLSVGLESTGGPSSTPTGGADPTDASGPSSGSTAGPEGSSGSTSGDGSTGTTGGMPGTSGGSTGTSGDASGGTTGGSVPMPVACEGKIWECGDGIDNDGDGAIDGGDKECTSPCDDRENSFQTELPGMAKDCKNDCYWDPESGVGNDGCEYSLECDAQNPGAQIKCGFDEVCDPKITAQCLDVCVPIIPNGCDCFGCCHIETPNGMRDIYLGSSPLCSLGNLDACESCTFQEGCQNPCEEDKCEQCFGQSEPPEGCGPATCDPGVMPCEVDQNGVHDCGEGFFCSTGCCYPIVPG